MGKRVLQPFSRLNLDHLKIFSSVIEFEEMVDTWNSSSDTALQVQLCYTTLFT